jgi:hypothetical protein
MKPGDANEHRVMLIAGLSRHSAMVSSRKKAARSPLNQFLLPWIVKDVSVRRDLPIPLVTITG